ncbi:type III secretion system cytoplasmic ring protein SctQ [Aestuariibius sp. 2305UL40-4]|uniref:type III secretion system cytoplasmic ring protein SctQ n=1 Tax=Aestuariibius violaceus TaxID=3234132 RepID=UPI00345F0629
MKSDLRPFRPRRLPAGDLYLRNALIARGGLVLGTFAGQMLTVDIDSSPQVSHLRSTVLGLRLGQDVLAVRVRESLLKAVLGTLETQAEGSFALDVVFDAGLTKLEDRLGQPISFARAPAVPRFVETGLVLSFGRLISPLWLDQRAAELLVRLYQPQRRMQPDLLVPLSIQSGSARLAVGQIQALRPGDILLPDDPQISLSHATLQLGNNLTAMVALRDGQAILEEEPKPMTTAPEIEPGMNLDSDTSDCAADNSAGGADPLAELTLDVRIELARLTLSLDALSEVGPGHVIPLDNPIARVRVLVAGRPIATGELVQVGERLGVQILGKPV